jgi:GAF domain-containing protein
VIHIDFHSPADLPPNEEQRQRAVERSGVLKRRRDPKLQKVVDEAAEMFDTPMAAITIMDHERQFLAARTGIEAEETPRAVSFCAHAILRPGEPLVVPDARRDQRFSGNPLVMFAPHIRFYAGVPLVDRQGYPLGALCIIDSKPREEPPNMFELSLLAREAERLINRGA